MTPITTSISHHKQGQKDRRSHDEGYIQGRGQGRDGPNLVGLTPT